jgi:hypothetical protein
LGIELLTLELDELRIRIQLLEGEVADLRTQLHRGALGGRAIDGLPVGPALSCSQVAGANVVAQDGGNTFLGSVKNSFSSDSIFNDFGTYGSEFSSDSIWNEFSTFGNEFSSYSPFNDFTTTPPLLVKAGQVIGYLSSNGALARSISPNLLKSLCEDVL